MTTYMILERDQLLDDRDLYHSKEALFSDLVCCHGGERILSFELADVRGGSGIIRDDTEELVEEARRDDYLPEHHPLVLEHCDPLPIEATWRARNPDWNGEARHVR